VSSVISDLFWKHQVPDGMVRILVTGDTNKSVSVLDCLPFVRKGLSKLLGGLDLSLVGDLLSGKSLPLLG
jgi:hypothetical protein